ncbi:hypothetical protein [Polaromonas sp. C04]|uniref:hypothetical protein n=1 Tax=Polaromonas sp. C04 TaxID=1945857 RepID=UPI0009873F40|nr:hypothetical protein [Polaromonas sp. C04]OOG58691.1 hypothetical protein B0E49_01910 [Polaromonas sp. C04]
MNRMLLISAVLVTLSLGACDKQPTVVNVPAAPAAVPGPAGPPGATGATGDQGNQGSKGDPGKTGNSTAVIVVPPASAPAN